MKITHKNMLLVSGALAAILFVGQASAQNGRFVMEKTENGYIRMDTETGAMSICEAKSDQVICKMAADERRAYDADIAALEDRVSKLESMVNGGQSFSSNQGLPSEEEFERGLGYMEKFMRRFMGIAKDLDAEPNKT